MSVLVLAELDNDVLSPATARIVAAATQLGPVDLVVSGPQAVAESASGLSGVARVILAPATALAEGMVDLLTGLAPGYDYLVASASTTGKDVMPRLAARLDIQPARDLCDACRAIRRRI